MPLTLKITARLLFRVKTTVRWFHGSLTWQQADRFSERRGAKNEPG